jgi:hypothetical protein
LLGLLAEDGFVVKTIRAREAFFAHLVLAWGFTDIYVPFGDVTEARNAKHGTLALAWGGFRWTAPIEVR